MGNLKNCTIKYINDEEIIKIGQNVDTFPTFSNKFIKASLGKFLYYSPMWEFFTAIMLIFGFFFVVMCAIVAKNFTVKSPTITSTTSLFQFISSTTVRFFNKNAVTNDINYQKMFITFILIYTVFFLIFDGFIMPFFRQNEYIGVYQFGLYIWLISYFIIGIILPTFIFLIIPTLVYNDVSINITNNQFYIFCLVYIFAFWCLNTHFVNQLVNTKTKSVDYINPFTKYYRNRQKIKYYYNEKTGNNGKHVKNLDKFERNIKN